MARKGRIYSNVHCLFCAKIRKSSDIYDKYGHFFTVSSILQRILFVFSQINPLLSPRTLPRHLVCRRKCLYVFQHTLWWNDIYQWKLSSIVDSSPFSFALSLFINSSSPKDYRLVFEIEFVKQLYDGYVKKELEIWHTFTDTILKDIMGDWCQPRDVPLISPGHLQKSCALSESLPILSLQKTISLAREKYFPREGGKNLPRMHAAFSMSPKPVACQAIPVSIPNKACGKAPWRSWCICFCPFCLSTWINVSIPKFQLTWKMQERHIPDKRNIYSSPIRLLTFSP